jgi:hypothetical protein
LRHTPGGSGRPDDASSSGEDEAEFAWLPVDCLKPFQPGDAAAASEVDPSRAENANLRACVVAAGKVSERFPDEKTRAAKFNINSASLHTCVAAAGTVSMRWLCRSTPCNAPVSHCQTVRLCGRC